MAKNSKPGVSFNEGQGRDTERGNQFVQNIEGRGGRAARNWGKSGRFFTVI